MAGQPFVSDPGIDESGVSQWSSSYANRQFSILEHRHGRFLQDQVSRSLRQCS